MPDAFTAPGRIPSYHHAPAAHTADDAANAHRGIRLNEFSVYQKPAT